MVNNKKQFPLKDGMFFVLFSAIASMICRWLWHVENAQEQMKEHYFFVHGQLAVTWLSAIVNLMYWYLV